MFIKSERKPLKYVVAVMVKGNEWAHKKPLTNYEKAHNYAMTESDGGFDCRIICTRGEQFEYEKLYYGLTESQRAIKSLPEF